MSPPEEGNKEPADLRGKVVEILSGTTNGCLSELGYVPGMAERLQQATQQVASLQSENAKLFEDNRKLSNTSRALNEHLTFAQANGSSQLAHLMRLLGQLKERDATLHKHQQLLSPNQAYQQLLAELQRLRNAHAETLSQLALLNDKYANLWNAYHAVLPSSSSHQSSIPFVPGRSLSYNQSRQPQHEKRASDGQVYLIPTPAQDHARSLAAPSNPTRPNHPQALQQLQQLPANGLPQRQPAQSHKMSEWPSAGIPPGRISGQVSPIQAVFPAQPTIPPSNGRPLRPPIVIPSTHTSYSGHRITSAPTSAVPRLPVMIPPYSAPPVPTRAIPPAAIDLTADSPPGPSGDPAPMTQPISLPQNSVAISPPTVLPHSQIVNGNSSTIPSLPQSSVTSAASDPTSLLPQTQNVGTHSSSKESLLVLLQALDINLPPKEISHPSTQTLNDSASQTNSKRPRDTADTELNLNTDDPYKKPRIVPEQCHEDLRSKEDCVRMIFAEDGAVEDAFYCEICLARHELGLLSEAPDLEVKPDFDMLLKHCKEEHPTVWDDLRHKRELVQ
ncbi:hypothetical protein BJ138DRAFT_1108932 [Hygrophoropsis aurantiaca]|uniref:Uncharacterized protein n=1 Tax=Hygrophoropsis aurantiaca TaxID=72124 RepID=A0ACB8AT08_9AGAM|nr:hypothetical protein BJ138DRAFT_1108932 [Hygrophoropsis aurantiaca]